MIIIQDDFYPNPDEVRKQALQMFFEPGQKGKSVNFAGQRSRGTFSTENRLYCKNKIGKLINRNIITFPTKNSNCAFTIGKDKNNYHGQPYANWIHHDKGDHETGREKVLGGTMFAAVCYLTPNSPSGHGTGLFYNKTTKKVYAHDEKLKTRIFGGQWKDDNEWVLHTYSEHIYNRIIIYPATYWHAPFNAGFGHDKYTGRLIQVFFFWAEKSGLDLGYEKC